jgi:nicotinamidase-related amidase
MIVDIPAILPQSPIPDFLTLSNRGFYPVVVSDCVSSMDKEAHERSLKNLEKIVIVKQASEILKSIGTK